MPGEPTYFRKELHFFDDDLRYCRGKWSWVRAGREVVDAVWMQCGCSLDGMWMECGWNVDVVWVQCGWNVGVLGL